MKWTLRHYYPFGRTVGDTLLSRDAWDRLRTSPVSGPGAGAFYLPSTRSDWLDLCRASASSERMAADIASIVEAYRHRAVLSVGVGRACAEFHLKQRMPGIRLTCAEYSPRTLERLRLVFTECDRLLQLDMRTMAWPAIDDTSLVLLNRVDTELDDEQWSGVFSSLARAGARHILLVATGFVTIEFVVREAWVRAVSAVRREPLTFAGYTRTRSRFRQLWAPCYRVVAERMIGDEEAFLLEKV